MLFDEEAGEAVEAEEKVQQGRKRKRYAIDNDEDDEEYEVGGPSKARVTRSSVCGRSRVSGPATASGPSRQADRYPSPTKIDKRTSLLSVEGIGARAR